MTYNIFRRHEITMECATDFDALRRKPVAKEKARLFWWVFKSCRCSEETKRTYQVFGHIRFDQFKQVRVGGPQSQDRQDINKQLSCLNCGREVFYDFDDLEAYVEVWAKMFYIQETATLDTSYLDEVHKLEVVQGRATAYTQLRKATEEELLRYYGYRDFTPVNDLNI